MDVSEMMAVAMSNMYSSAISLFIAALVPIIKTFWPLIAVYFIFQIIPSVIFRLTASKEDIDTLDLLKHDAHEFSGLKEKELRGLMKDDIIDDELYFEILQEQGVISFSRGNAPESVVEAAGMPEDEAGSYYSDLLGGVSDDDKYNYEYSLI